MGFCRGTGFAGFELNFTIPSSRSLWFIGRKIFFIIVISSEGFVDVRKSLANPTITSSSVLSSREFSNFALKLLNIVIRCEGWKFYGNFQLDMRVLLQKHCEVNDDKPWRVEGRSLMWIFQPQNVRSRAEKLMDLIEPWCKVFWKWRWIRLEVPWRLMLVQSGGTIIWDESIFLWQYFEFPWS